MFIFKLKIERGVFLNLYNELNIKLLLLTLILSMMDTADQDGFRPKVFYWVNYINGSKNVKNENYYISRYEHTDAIVTLFEVWWL